MKKYVEIGITEAKHKLISKQKKIKNAMTSWLKNVFQKLEIRRKKQARGSYAEMERTCWEILKKIYRNKLTNINLDSCTNRRSKIKNHKKPPESRIRTEMLKLGGEHTEKRIYKLIWNQEEMSIEWSSALIYSITKKGCIRY